MQEPQLVTRKSAAGSANVSLTMIAYWAKRGYIKKYYVFGNKYNYLVDLNEVMQQDRLGYERRRVLYNKNWNLQSRGPDGTFLPLSN